MLEHGGRLLSAAKKYGRPAEDWLDLSTGINSLGWPAPEVPANVWVRLPEAEDSLVEAAAKFYGSVNVLPVAGSQAAVQTLPKLRRSCRVGIVSPSYNEHLHAWRKNGHEIVHVYSFAEASGHDSATTGSTGTGAGGAAVLSSYDGEYGEAVFRKIAAALEELDVLLLCNPNNPTGLRFSREQLLALHQRLERKGGWLLVDEAFADDAPEESIVPETGREGLIVLRSLGKFFGLAGARVGFVFAEPSLRTQLEEELGPWTIAAPSRWIASAALNDRHWHEQARRDLKQRSLRLKELLTRAGLEPTNGTSFFQWVVTDRCQQLNTFFGAHGILVRSFSRPPSLRFGLPANEEDWERLETCLAKMVAILSWP